MYFETVLWNCIIQMNSDDLQYATRFDQYDLFQVKM